MALREEQEVFDSFPKSYITRHAIAPFLSTKAPFSTPPRRSAPRICAIAPLSCPKVPLLLSHVVLCPPPKAGYILPPTTSCTNITYYDYAVAAMGGGSGRLAWLQDRMVPCTCASPYQQLPFGACNQVSNSVPSAPP